MTKFGISTFLVTVSTRRTSIHHLKAICAFLLAFGFLAGAVPMQAYAATVRTINFPGSMCASSPSAGTAGHHIGGIYNPSSSEEMLIYCPMPVDGGGTLLSVLIGGFDRSTTNDIWCTIYQRYSDDGGIVNYGNLGTTGGYTGAPYQTAGFLSGSAGFGGGALSLECHIPRVNPSGGVSHLTQYQLRYSTP